MSLSRRLARPMLSAVFVIEGIDTLRNPGPRVKVSEDVAPRVAATVGLPTNPELLVKINAGVQVGAGMLLGIGKFRRLSALALVASMVPTTAVGHRFWQSDDPEERHQQQIHLLKNVGILGGLILELVDTEGAPSLGWRARRATRHAAVLLSGGAKSRPVTSRQLARQAGRGAARAATVAAAAKNAKDLARGPAEQAERLWSARSGTVDSLHARGQQATHLLEAGSERANDLLSGAARQVEAAWQSAIDAR